MLGGCAVNRVGVRPLVLIAAVAALLAFYPELVDARFRTYKKFYGHIQVGMTREQVLAAMEQRYPTRGRRKRPNILNDTPDSWVSS
jgi:hypothetical protein